MIILFFYLSLILNIILFVIIITSKEKKPKKEIEDSKLPHEIYPEVRLWQPNDIVNINYWNGRYQRGSDTRELTRFLLILENGKMFFKDQFDILFIAKVQDIVQSKTVNLTLIERLIKNPIEDDYQQECLDYQQALIQ